MSEHDFGLSVGQRRHQRASPLWVVAAITLTAFAALAVSLPSVSPVFHLGERAAGRLGGYVAEAMIGVPVGGAIAYLIWRQVNWSRFERLTKYFLLAFIGWSVGMVLGTLTTLDLDNANRNQPPPPGGSVDAAYWRARVGDLNTYQQGFTADLRGLQRLPTGSAEAQAQVTRMRATLAAARARNSGGFAQRQAALEAMGNNEIQRRALLLAFEQRVQTGELAVSEYWAIQARRLDEVARAVAARRRPIVSYPTELRVWEETAHLNSFLNSIRAVPGAGTGLPQFETDLPPGLHQ